jgi:integrase
MSNGKRKPLPPFAIRWHEGSSRKQESGFRTASEAEERLASIRTGIRDGTLDEKRRARIGFDKVADEWLRLHSAVALRSHDRNEDTYRVHVQPFFGDCPLSSVDVLKLRAHLQTKVRTRKERDGDGKLREREYKLSVRTINLVMALVRSILRFAVAKKYLTTAPTDLLGRGKLMLKVEKPELEPPIKHPADVGRLLEAIRELRPDRFAMFATFVYTGARKGEVLGLRWANIDLERRTITIRHSYAAGQTKSGKHRNVPIPPPLVDILRRHRIEEPYQGELVFPNDAGEAYTKNSKLEDVLRAALKRVGLPQIRIHDLRHVYASHWLMAGGSLADLKRNLGHHSVAFTDAVYGHLSADHRVKESDRLAGLFEAPPPAKVLQFSGKDADSTRAVSEPEDDTDDAAENLNASA